MWQRNHEITAARALWRTSIFLPVWSPSVPQVSNNILARGLTKYGKIAFATRNVRYSHLYNISYIQNSWFFLLNVAPRRTRHEHAFLPVENAQNKVATTSTRIAIEAPLAPPPWPGAPVVLPCRLVSLRRLCHDVNPLENIVSDYSPWKLSKARASRVTEVSKDKSKKSIKKRDNL